VGFINSYFDFNDYEQPVKQYIDDSLFYEIEPNRLKKVNFYVMKSEIELQDSYFQLGQRDSYEFVQVQNQRFYDDSNTEDPSTLITLYIRYDARYEVYERKIYSALELLRDLGGLQRSMYVIGLILVNFFSYRIYVASVLK
jgi:hypothetical protein